MSTSFLSKLMSRSSSREITIARNDAELPAYQEAISQRLDAYSENASFKSLFGELSEVLLRPDGTMTISHADIGNTDHAIYIRLSVTLPALKDGASTFRLHG
jgi:hypothetical protein